MSRYPEGMPPHPQLFRASVVCTYRLSPTFQRVRVASEQLADFTWLGLDHWFRLFIPTAEQRRAAADAGVLGTVELPDWDGRAWYKPYLAMPDEARPHCANYTVADFSVKDAAGDDGVQSSVGVMDIDVVLHPDEAGEFSAPVADWAINAVPGSPVALLDQGVLFLPPDDVDQYIVAVEDTGVPAARQIVHDLPADANGTVLIEVADPGDVEAWEVPDGLTVEWLVREAGERVNADGALAAAERRAAPATVATELPVPAVPGTRALARVRELAATSAPSTNAYAFAVGESTLATGTRRALVAAGLDKKRITFSGFWKHGEARG